MEFDSYLTECPFRATRRDSQVRPAHDAEIDDIMAIFDVLDNSDLLQGVRFFAVQLNRLLKYGPYEINVCLIADRQIEVEADVQSLNAVLIALKDDFYH